MDKNKHNLFQFWNTPVLPQEIEDLMRTWREDTDFIYRRFNSATAGAYIAEKMGARAHDAYVQCAVPAMQADFFRYCALYQEGGVYVDADTENGGNLAGLIGNAARGVLMNRQTKIANDFLFFRHRCDPLLEKVIARMIENIENRISNNVWLVTGPGIMSHMHHDAANKSMFEGLVVKDVRVVREIVQFRNDLDYKSSVDDWRSNLGAGAPSIFKDV